MKRALALLLAVLAVGGLAAARVGAAPACTIMFDGGTDGTGTAWGTGTNWNTNLVPGTGDDVCIGDTFKVVHSTGTDVVRSVQSSGDLQMTGGSLELTRTGDDSTIKQLTMSSGTLLGAARVVIGSAMTWSGGTMTGAGTTAVASGATLTQSGTVSLSAGRVLEVGGTFDKAGDVTLLASTAPLVHVLAGGVLRKSAGSGTGRIDAPLTNDGAVRSSSGTLSLDGGSAGGSGAFGAASATGTVAISGGTWTLDDGARWLGGVSQTGGTVSVAAAATLTVGDGNAMTSGTLGGTGTVALASGTFTWSGGTMTEAGLTQIGAAATLTQSGTVSLSAGRVLEVGGTFDKAGDVTLLASTAPLVHVLAGGVVRKSAGSGAGRIDAPLTNDGAVRSSSGTLSLDGGSAGGSGAFGAASATGTVAISGGTWTLDDGARWLGGVSLTGGTVQVPAGTLAVSDANAMTAGTLGGAGNVALASGTFTWSGGAMSGTGTTALAAGATLTQSGTVSLTTGRVLAVSGTFDKPGDFTLLASGAPATLVHVLAGGLLQKSGGASTGRIDPPLTNDGAVRSTSGVLGLDGGSAGGTGAFGAAGATGTVAFSGATWTLGDGATFLGGVSLTGATVQVAAAGTLTVSGANAMTAGTLGGTGTALLASGTFTWSSGTMAGAGTTTVADGATLTQTGTTSITTGRVLDVAGTFDKAGDVTLLASGAPAPVVHVLAGGVMSKSAGAGTARVDPALRNDGLVSSSSGLLTLQTGASQASTGTFHGTDRTNLVVFGNGTHTLGTGAQLTGWVQVTGGTLGIAQGVTEHVPDHLLLTGGTLTGPGTLQVDGALELSFGTLKGPGAATIAPAGTLTVTAPGCSSTVTGAFAIANQGTIALDGGAKLFVLGPGATLANSGRVNLGTAGAPCGTRPEISAFGNTVRNTGTIEKVGGGSEGEVDGLDNDGTVLSSSGDLQLSAQGVTATQAGSFASSGDGNRVSFISGPFVLEPAATFGGQVRIAGAEVDLPAGAHYSAPALAIASGTLGGEGTLTVTGTLDWSGGAMSGGGATVLAPAAVANVSSPPFSSVSLDTGRQLINHGTVTLGGVLGAFSGASVLNTGTFELATGADVFGSSGDFFDELFHNTGTLRHTAAGTTTFDMPLDNDGTVTVTAGRLDLSSLLNLSENGDLVGGTFEAHGAVLGVPAAVGSLGAALVLDGAAAKLDVGGDDALANLRQVTGNGSLLVTGGRSQAVSGALRNAGVLGVGPGSTLSAGGAYAQAGTATTALALDGHLDATAYTAAAGSVLRATLAATGGAPLALTGAATLAGTLALVTPPGFTPAAGTDLPLLSATPVTGTFAPLTGDKPGGPIEYQAGYGAAAVTIHVAATGGRGAPPAPVPVPTAAAPAPAPPAIARAVAPPPAPVLAVERGGWARVGAALVATRRGATLVARHVTARRVAVLVRTGPGAGVIEISWRGRRVRRVDLGAFRRGTRRIRLVTGPTGTLRIRVVRAGRVAVLGLRP